MGVRRGLPAPVQRGALQTNEAASLGEGGGFILPANLVTMDRSVLELQVTGVSVTGPDAAMFTVFAIAPDGSKVTATFPIMLQSGRPQYFALQFCPTRYGQLARPDRFPKTNKDHLDSCQRHCR